MFIYVLYDINGRHIPKDEIQYASQSIHLQLQSQWATESCIKWKISVFCSIVTFMNVAKHLDYSHSPNRPMFDIKSARKD